MLCSEDNNDNKNKNLDQYILNIDFFSDYKSLITNCVYEIKKSFDTIVNNELEIIKIIDKHFLDDNNIKICEDIKNKLLNNKEDSDLFFSLFNNVEFDENTYTLNPTIVEEMTPTSIFNLKKENDKIILLEIINSIDIKIIISDTELEQYRKIKEYEKIFSDKNNPEIKKMAEDLVKIILKKYDFELKNNEIVSIKPKINKTGGIVQKGGIITTIVLSLLAPLFVIIIIQILYVVLKYINRINFLINLSMMSPHSVTCFLF